MNEETYEEEKIKCPYCGYEQRDDLQEFERGRSNGVECNECGKIFDVETEFVGWYTAIPKDNGNVSRDDDK